MKMKKKRYRNLMKEERRNKNDGEQKHWMKIKRSNIKTKEEMIEKPGEGKEN